MVGSVIANREREEVEKLIGFLANTIVLRVEMAGGGSFREVLRRVREACLEAYAHQLPPEKLVGGELVEGAGEGRRREGRLFEVWFQMESAGREKLELSGLKWESYPVERPNARFELSLVLVEHDNNIFGEMEYDATLFEDRTISQMLDDYAELVKDMAVAPDQSF